LVGFLLFFSILAQLTLAEESGGKEITTLSGSGLEVPFVVTQLPVGTGPQWQGPQADGMLRANYGLRARLVMVLTDSSTRILSRDFHSACDPEISFDGSHILFAGKKTARDNWNIYEAAIDGSNVRQITDLKTDCRNPSYQATLYTIISSKPWYQMTFVGSEKDQINEFGSAPALNLYSCKLDGSGIRRLTYNLSSDMDPVIMPDGRLLYAGWQRSTLKRGTSGRISLFGINTDGTDNAAFSTDEGKAIKHMPCVTTKGQAVFVEADTVPWDGAGTLAGVTLTRPLHSYRPITSKNQGLFHSPSPLPDDRVLVSRRSTDGTDTHGVYILDPSSGHLELVFDNPEYHDIQAKAVCPRPEPDGRSSVVTEKDPYGKLYCLNVYTSDLENTDWMPEGTIKRIRVLEGIPVTGNSVKQNTPSGAKASAVSHDGIGPLAQRRILGEFNISEDGSFNIEIPASIPIQLQTLDNNGMALRNCSWIWAKNHEPRGCIGCHEDAELTPENVFVDALKRPSIKLTLPEKQRRTVNFRRDIKPIIIKKCASCHGKDNTHLNLSESGAKTNGYESLLAESELPGRGKYIHPALIWYIFGRNTSRPWDEDYYSQNIPPGIPPEGSGGLTDDEKRTFVEWIDTGAMYDSVPK